MTFSESRVPSLRGARVPRATYPQNANLTETLNLGGGRTHEIADDEKTEILGGRRVRAKKSSDRRQKQAGPCIRGPLRIRTGWRRYAVPASGRKDWLETDAMDA
jgi:hypothetical protein